MTCARCRRPDAECVCSDEERRTACAEEIVRMVEEDVSILAEEGYVADERERLVRRIAEFLDNRDFT